VLTFRVSFHPDIETRFFLIASNDRVLAE